MGNINEFADGLGPGGSGKPPFPSITALHAGDGLGWVVSELTAVVGRFPGVHRRPGLHTGSSPLLTVPWDTSNIWATRRIDGVSGYIPRQSST